MTSSSLNRALETVLGSGNDTVKTTDLNLESSEKTTLNRELYVKEGILQEGEDFETIYLEEDEIQKYLEQYMRENPGTEVETRYINREPVSLPQNIEVRWLRPITPEIPPIVIQEVNVIEKEERPIKIVQKPPKQTDEPIIFREKPVPFLIPEPKTIYVPNLVKRDEKEENLKEIKIEHVRSNSQSNFNSRLVYDDQVFDNNNNKRHQAYSYEQVNSTADYEDDEDDDRYKTTFSFKPRYRSSAEEEEIQLYEEKLMQTLYEEYLLKLERERLERKLSQSGIFEERIIQRERERSVSQERSFTYSQRLSNRYQNRSQNRSNSQTQARINEERYAEEMRRQRLRDEKLIQEQESLRDEEFVRYSRLTKNQQNIRNEERSQNQSSEDTTSKKDNHEFHLNSSVLINKGPSDGTTSSFKSINFTKVTDESELNQWNKLLNSLSEIKNTIQTERTMSSSVDLDPLQQIMDTLKKNKNADYHSAQSPIFKDTNERRSGSNNILKTSNKETVGLPKSDSISRSGSGLRRQKIETSYTSFYSSNYPNSVTEKNVYFRKEEI